jgi:peptide/nickel transport system substrate-binding protein
MISIDKLSKLYAAGRISRRDFMQGATAMGVTIAAASTMAVQAEASTPKTGGTLRVALGHGSTTDSFDPATFENGFANALCYSSGNHLTEINNEGQLQPELAESYTSDDGITWHFKIRKGVEFHNGKTLTPEDVIASINHHRGEESTSGAKGLLKALKGMSVDGDNVVFELEAANADWPFIMSDYHFKILPSKDGVAYFDGGVGTGGYKIDNFEPGVKLEASRFPNYWKENAAYFDGLVQTSVIDQVARQNALMNGEVDAIDRVNAQTVDLLASVPHVNIIENTGTLHYTFGMRLNVEPFGNYDLRMALKSAIKRQELVDKILNGHGALGNDHPISSANQYTNTDLPQREFDADKAAHHYKKSGHSGPIKIAAANAAFAGAVDAAQLIAASCAEAGITVEVDKVPDDGYWSNVWNNDAYGWSACYWGGRPTEDWMFSAAYVSGSDWNDTAWRGTDASKEFNELVVAARAELDTNKRKEMYYRCQALIHDDGGATIPMFANYINGLNKKIGHKDKMAANWDMDGGKASERWWFN